jgi:hypothetical protein
MVPADATIVVCPSPCVLANPLASTSATDGFVLCHCSVSELPSPGPVDPWLVLKSPKGGVLNASFVGRPSNALEEPAAPAIA